MPDPVTDRDIARLRIEAGQAGHLEVVALCDKALDGNAAARVECERLVRTRRAEGGSEPAG